MVQNWQLATGHTILPMRLEHVHKQFLLRMEKNGLKGVELSQDCVKTKIVTGHSYEANWKLLTL